MILSHIILSPLSFHKNTRFIKDTLANIYFQNRKIFNTRLQKLRYSRILTVLKNVAFGLVASPIVHNLHNNSM